jgi:hypothetical protein
MPPPELFDTQNVSLEETEGRCEPHAIHKQLRAHYMNVIARYQVRLRSDTSYIVCCVVSLKCELRLDTNPF